MRVLEQHTSADGLLDLVVVADGAGDTAIGFQGFASHTHGDILASLLGCSEEAATRRYIDAILQDETLIAVVWLSDEIRDAYVCDDPTSEVEGHKKYAEPDEELELRYWSGVRYQSTS